MSNISALPGSGATGTALSNESNLASTNANLYQQYIPQLFNTLSSEASGVNPLLTQEEQAALGNNAAQNQAEYKQAGAALNSRGLAGSNVPSSMMTQLANTNITQTGAIQSSYAQAQQQSQQQALMQLLGLTENTGAAAAGQWGTVGQMGANESASAGQALGGIGKFLFSSAPTGGFGGTMLGAGLAAI